MKIIPMQIHLDIGTETGMMNIIQKEFMWGTVGLILLEKFRHIHLDMENLILHFWLKQRIFYLKILKSY